MVRRAVYFDGAHIGATTPTLAIWAAAGLALIAVATHRTSGHTPNPQPQTQKEKETQ
jgi:hypothetical protein